MSENQAAMGFPARALGIFTAPSSVFEELARRPTWLAALLLITFSIMVLNGVVIWSKTGEAATRQQIQEALEKRGQTLPPEAVDSQIAIYRYAAPVSVLVVLPLATLGLAGLVYLIFSIALGGEGTFRQTFSVYTHVSLIGIVGAAVATGMVFLKGNLKSSTALSAFLPFLEETSFAYKFFQGMDLFILWQLAVVAIGMGIINKMATRKAATIIFSVYLVILVLITVVRQALS